MSLDDRHKKTVAIIADEHYAEIRAQMKNKGVTSGRQALESAITEALKTGINFALEQEARAWQRVTELEDLVVGIVSHAPGSDLVRAREFAAGIKAEA